MYSVDRLASNATPLGRLSPNAEGVPVKPLGLLETELPVAAPPATVATVAFG